MALPTTIYKIMINKHFNLESILGFLIHKCCFVSLTDPGNQINIHE